MGYWIASFALIAFGFVTGLSIGLPFFLIGMAMLVLSPVRRRPLAFWPAFLGFAAFNLSFLLITPAYCSATMPVGDGSMSLQTSCSSFTGIPWPTDATGSGPTGAAFAISGLVALVIGIVVFALVYAWLYIERAKRRRSNGSATA
jgi:hypothetical protein